jgi:hypothetical protein
VDEEPEQRELSLRLLVPCAALLLAGCFQPVTEAKIKVKHADAGHGDAGSGDAGARDGGKGDGGCQSFSDCVWDGGGTCAAAGLTGGPSCIGGICLVDCPGGRSCSIADPPDSGRCLQCGADKLCAGKTCTAGPHCSFTVTKSTCANVPVGTMFGVVTHADCQQVAAGLGTWVDVSSGTALADFPSLGGVCTGQDLFTNVPRMQFNCPACQFTEEGCD